VLNLTTDLIENGVFVARGIISDHDVVYDQNGTLVADSCVRRGVEKENNFSGAPERLPKNLTPNHILKHEALFLGPYDMTHYGHWLTEGVARLWFLRQEKNVRRPILTGTTRPQSLSRRLYDMARRRTPNWMLGLSALGVEFNRFTFCAKPVRIASIIVPSCSIYLRHGIHAAHLDVTRAIGKALCKAPITPRSSLPVYLSRAKQTNQISTYQGHDEVDAFCHDEGFRVVYPETMSLSEQIALFNQHDTFIGFFGSAFHTLLMRWADEPTTNILLGPADPNPTYFHIDRLMGNATHHIDCCRVLEDRRRYECDPQLAIAGIRKALALRPV